MKNEVKIGVLVLVASVCLFVILFFIKDVSFVTGKQYIIRFYSLAGLETGALVQVYGGIRVGQIEEITFDQFKASVRILVNDENVIRMLGTQRSQFSIQSVGMIDRPHILIEFDRPLSTQIPVPQNQDEIPVIEGLEQNSLSDLLAYGSSLTQKTTLLLDGYVTQILQGIERQINNKTIDAIVLQSFEASKKLNLLLSNAAQFLQHLDALVLKVKDDSLDNSLASFTKTLDSVQKAVHILTQDAQKLLHSTDTKLSALLDASEARSPVHKLNTLLQEMTKLIRSFHQLTHYANDEKTPVGAFFKDKELTKKLHTTLEELNLVLTKAKKSFLLRAPKETKGTF